MANEVQPVIETSEVSQANQEEAKPAVETGSAPDASQEPIESKPPEAEGSEPEKPLGEKGTAELIRLRKRAQEAERELAYQKGLNEGRQPAQAPIPPKHITEPKIDDFDNYDDFVVAKASYKIRKEQQEENAKVQVEQYEKAWNERLAKAQEKTPEVLDAIRDVGRKISREMAIVIKDSDVGPEIALYLQKNPNEITRLSRIHPVSMSREIGKIEAKLQSAPMETKPNKITQAPEPIKPVGGRTQAVTTDQEKIPIEDFMSRRNSETFVKDGRGRLVHKR